MNGRYRILIAVVLCFCTATVYGSPKNILILSAKLGNGHEAAARAIAKGITDRDPSVKVTIKDVYEFPNFPFEREFAALIYNKIVAHAPELWDKIYRNYNYEASSLNSILDLKRTLYNEKALLKYIKDNHFDEIVCTFNHATESVAALRAQGLLPGIKISWIHTDYVVQRYHELLAKSIDMTYLAHPILVSDFIEDGVPKEKVLATGMPINPLARQKLPSEEKTTLLNSIGLNDKTTTLTLMSGGEGVGDFVRIIRSIAGAIHEPIQIIAICANNKSHYEKLSHLIAAGSLPANIKLVALKGFIPNEKVISLIKASDIYVTKSGGISPTEAFAIGKPLAIMDINGGQERFNTNFMVEQKLALGAKTEDDVGGQVLRLLRDPTIVAEMLAAQRLAADNIDLDRIAQYVLGLPINPVRHPEQIAAAQRDHVRIAEEVGPHRITCKDILQLARGIITGKRH